MKKGLFITFEGIDGAGKSVQAQLLKVFFAENGKNVIMLREPGGTELGERIRELLQSPSLNFPSWSEVFLFLSSRKKLIEEIVIPHLDMGGVVILDRFSDSTYAYQGYGEGLNIEHLELIHSYAGIDIKPDITFLLDISPEKAFERIRRGREGEISRIEKFSISFFEKVRNGYLALSKKDPERIKLIDADNNICDIHNRIIEILKENGLV